MSINPRVVRVTVNPWAISDGSQQTLRWAGGGDRTAYYWGGNHYRAGVLTYPRFKVEVEVGENGWTGAAVPTTGALSFAPSSSTYYDQLAAYYWAEAPILVEVGEEVRGVVSTWTTVLSGTVAEVSTDNGTLSLTITALAAAYQKPLLTGRFAGTGGIEGPSQAANRLKRRSWGRVFNVEGQILDVANSIWEFGDPAFPISSFVTVRDKGRAASPAPTVLAWQGSIAATFTALQAATVAAGSAVVAPSIACVKWWTQPAGPLTADLLGEVGAGYVENAHEIAQRLQLVGLGANNYDATTYTALGAAQYGASGLHINDDATTLANALDRLLLGVGTAWTISTTGVLFFRPFTFASPVETLLSDKTSRDKVLPPVKTRRLGFMKNERQHTDAEIAADILVAEINGLGALATSDYVTLGTNVRNASGVGPLNPTPAQVITDQGTASGIAGQGSLATQNSADFATQVTGSGRPDDFAAVGENLVANSSLALGYDNWTIGGGTTWAAAANGDPVPGFLQSTTHNAFFYANKADSPTTRIPIFGGRLYFLNCYVRSLDIAANKVQFEVNYYKADKTTGTGSAVVVLAAGASNGTWTPVALVLGVSPTDAAYCRIVGQFSLGNPGAGTTKFGGLRVATSEDAADVTSYVDGVADLIVNASSSGVPVAAQLPRTSGFRLWRNGVDVTTLATWSVTVLSGTLSASVGAATGVLSVDVSGGILTSGRVRLSAAYGGATRTKDVTISRNDAPQDTGTSGTGGTSASGSLGGTTTSATPASISAASLIVTSGSGGQVSLSSSYTFTSSGIGFKAIATRWQRKISGVWTDIGSAKANDYAYYYNATDEITEDGSGGHAETITGLGANVSGLEFRLTAYNTGTNTTTGRVIYGTQGAVGA